MIEQLEDRHAQPVGDDFDGIDRRVCLTILNSAQISLVEATLLAELYLAQAGLQTEFADAGTKKF